MVIITACIYYLLLALMFFIEVPELLVIVVGAGVFLVLTLDHLRGGSGRGQGDRIWSFVRSACIAALILIALGVMRCLHPLSSTRSRQTGARGKSVRGKR